jgi:hypothetical protein
MIRRVLASELGGKVKLEFNAGGLECSIDAPLNSLPDGFGDALRSDGDR